MTAIGSCDIRMNPVTLPSVNTTRFAIALKLICNHIMIYLQTRTIPPRVD